MGLIDCPDCHNQVSERAPSCPQCGSPLAAQTIEATGKRWKGLQVLSGVVFAGSTVVVFGQMSAGAGDSAWVPAMLALVSLATFAVARLGAWWQHG